MEIIIVKLNEWIQLNCLTGLWLIHFVLQLLVLLKGNCNCCEPKWVNIFKALRTEPGTWSASAALQHTAKGPESLSRISGRRPQGFKGGAGAHQLERRGRALQAKGSGSSEAERWKRAAVFPKAGKRKRFRKTGSCGQYMGRGGWGWREQRPGWAFKDILRVCLVTQWCPTLCDPMDCSPPASSFHGIFQVRIQESVVMSFSRGSSWPRGQTCIACDAGRFFTC